LLTSATHHTYKLPSSVVKRARALHLPTESAEDRYTLLVAAEDALLGQVVNSLRKTGCLENTLIVVGGDHGEGFGAHGVKQHDNNFYEEGLHVPFVMAGPGVEPGEFSGPANMVDLLPTLLGRLGLEPNGEALTGQDLLDPHG